MYTNEYRPAPMDTSEVVLPKALQELTEQMGPQCP